MRVFTNVTIAGVDQAIVVTITYMSIQNDFETLYTEILKFKPIFALFDLGSLIGTLKRVSPMRSELKSELVIHTRHMVGKDLTVFV